MREIKFRAWQKLGEEYGGELAGIMHYTGGYGENNELYVKRTVVIAGFYSDSGWDWSDYKIMQYTGLKDKNGKEIYEGDILTFTVFDHNGCDEQYSGVVKFACGEWQIWYSVNSEYYGSDGAFHLFAVHIQDEEIEIIGNIYENPELLGNDSD